MFDEKSFLSFGGGVQSTALALMLAKNPEVFERLNYRMPMHIIFADTGAEPSYVLENVQRVFEILQEAGLKTYTVTAKDSIIDDAPNFTGRGISTPPYYTKDKYGGIGILRRQCTEIYKIEPITEKQREILGFGKRKRIPADTANLWMGISIEEAQRAKPSENKWLAKRYPLIDLRLDRTACAVYAYKILGYVVQKSACFFCPFKHTEEWVSMKRDRPKEFEEACEFDERIRSLAEKNKSIKNECFIHRSAMPLRDAVGQGVQLSLFNQPSLDCSGNCFV
jgi:3'-phosphoadenosine 5'-phosphosulfate sulfotransferase (PAPS reductase)/FAD synthetase